MNRLFLKIFLWFWATVIALGIALVLSFVLAPKSSYIPWQSMRGIAANVFDELDRHGPAGANDLLARLAQNRQLEACLFDEHGNPIAGDHCTSFQPTVQKALQSPTQPDEVNSSVYRTLLRQRSRDGKEYLLATQLPFGPGPVHKTLLGFVLHWLLILLISSAICYLLTFRLTLPILRLREASRQIADGNLSARVGSGVERRSDAFGDLGRDFNTMAARIEGLLSSQRQLISDVSHEVRSPLARMNLALDLARRRLGDDPAFDRLAADLEKLNDLIGKLLTVARLESGAATVARDSVDLARLVAEIAGDAEIEARERRCSIVCECAGEFRVLGSENLLRSAIENVIRNAVYYTRPDTQIRVTLSSRSESATTIHVLVVRDHGPGVPETDTENIFKPFYRVAEARDRQSGGAGLGLAIASRVVQLHHGKISAANCEGSGLEVLIELPAA
ncbi:MAG: hypothetical protein C5B46_06515 [Proteobacteria bacterium]|nr:MAG: hypothetical protein C5B46_06515 [Pseudomonadota bacterium]